MANAINTRGIILDILLEINQKGEHSHIAIGHALEKYQYLSKQERAFISRVCEGTVEYAIQLDYIIDYFSKIKVDKMKPVIREILRSAVYQLKFMDSVPDSAVCNEAVKLAQKKGFYNLKPFVNGVLRAAARNMKQVVYPKKEEDLVEYLKVTYSMPEDLLYRWLNAYGPETTEKILKDFLNKKKTTIRCRQTGVNQKETLESLEEEGVHVEPAPYLDYAFYISEYNHLMALDAFRQGWVQVQDVSSMLVAEAASPKNGDYIIDICAAPGGKSLHLADKMAGYGMVDARDVTEYKVNLIRDNIARADAINIHATCMDGTALDQDSVERADIVLADVPCSGYGVIGKKPDIKYKMTRQKQDEVIILQRQILECAVTYVRNRGTFLYSTCTIAKEENEDNVEWLLKRFPLELESLDPYLPEELHSETTAKGYLQLLPGVHGTDGFFLARFRKK